MEKFIYDEKFLHPTRILLNVTDACNLACKYCFVQQHPHFMDLQVALDAVDWIVDNYYWKIEHFGDKIKYKFLSIYFFGGEPLLQWDNIIVPTVEYCKTQYPDLCFKFGFTTNGTLLNKERIEYCYKNHFYLLFSCDGNQKTQDYNRPCHDGKSSFKLLEPNIELLLQYFPDITCRSTLYPDTIENLFDDYCYIESKGFNWYAAVPDARTEWSEEKITILKEQMKKIFIRQINQYLLGIKPLHLPMVNDMFQLILSRDVSFLTEKEYLFDKKKPNNMIERCGLGANQCAIAYDGSIYGCQEQPSKGHKSHFYIGNLYEDKGINKDRHMELFKTYLERKNLICSDEKLCSESSCPLFYICYARDCPSTSWDLYENFYTENKIRCIWRQILFENCTTMMHILVDKKCELFKDFLNTLEIINFEKRGG